MFTMDLKQQHNPHPRQRFTKRQTNIYTHIHSNNVRRHDSSPNNKHPQSVSHPKPGPTQVPLFFTIFTSQNKVFTQTGNGGRFYQYDMIYEGISKSFEPNMERARNLDLFCFIFQRSPFQLHTLVPSSFPVINTRSVEVNILVP